MWLKTVLIVVAEVAKTVAKTSGRRKTPELLASSATKKLNGVARQRGPNGIHHIYLLSQLS
jgi:hypothetical protein